MAKIIIKYQYPILATNKLKKWVFFVLNYDSFDFYDY